MSDDRHPLDALCEVECPHTRHYAMCAPCAADAVRPEFDRLREHLAEFVGAIEYQCPRCARWATWTDGRSVDAGDEVDEFWCQTCGTESLITACVSRTEIERLREEAQRAEQAEAELERLTGSEAETDDAVAQRVHTALEPPETPAQEET